MFKQPKSRSLWIRYPVRGKPYRESAKTTDPKKAEEFLRFCAKQKGSHELGHKKFVGPIQERVWGNKLLDALEVDCKLRRVMSPQVESRLGSIREAFGDYKAVKVTAPARKPRCRDGSSTTCGEPQGKTWFGPVFLSAWL